MKKRFTQLLLFVCFLSGMVSQKASAQELDCRLSVVSTKITSGDKTVFDVLSKALNQFVNGRKWSNIPFQTQERIPCSMTIDIQEYNQGTGQMKAYLSVQLRRPCYKSTYTSTMLNIIDKDFSFRYMKNDPLEYNDNSIGTNLTATIAFYAYIILGNYMDSGYPRGGEVFFERANNIVMQAQSLSEQGWRASEKNDRNRYWIAENYNNGNYQAIHEVIYRYFRLGMDMMYDNPDQARVNILQAITQLNGLKRMRSSLACVQLFLESRADELVNIFQPAPQEERQKAVDLFVEVDPSNVTQYRKILSGAASR
ncbi:MAG: DUF4835 family protein [Bacteroides sp.]|nr:DUF4835 family protein [Ruminococcus flavefaciens]MCM1554608.1 DUF4835 family protein [Bacteroides sp.]